MTRRRDPFQTALVTLRTLAQSGAFAPGSPIVIIEEARRLGSSPTPVREALAWLCGEGLIDRAPAGGYLAPRCNAATVRDRFEFRLHCLLVGLDLTGKPNDQRSATVSERRQRPLAERFERLVRGAGNAVLSEAFERVGRQLQRLEPVEGEVFGDVEAEAIAVAGVLDAGQRPAIRQALIAYHQRRIEAAGLLVLHTENGRAASDEFEA